MKLEQAFINIFDLIWPVSKYKWKLGKEVYE
jgi:hypothetical protein